MKDALRNILFVVILIGMPVVFVSAGKGFGVQSDRVLYILAAVGLVVGYLVAKGIWGGKKD